jgi:hypothetical protein
MYCQITKLVNLLNLPQDIIFHILHLAGLVKLRNGKYFSQINKNYKIFRQIKELPMFQNGGVRLQVKTDLLFNKMILLANIQYRYKSCITISRKYEIARFFLERDGEMHHIATDENLLVLQNKYVYKIVYILNYFELFSII